MSENPDDEKKQGDNNKREAPKIRYAKRDNREKAGVAAGLIALSAAVGGAVGNVRQQVHFDDLETRNNSASALVTAADETRKWINSIPDNEAIGSETDLKKARMEVLNQVLISHDEADAAQRRRRVENYNTAKETHSVGEHVIAGGSAGGLIAGVGFAGGALYRRRAKSSKLIKNHDTIITFDESSPISKMEVGSDQQITVHLREQITKEQKQMLGEDPRDACLEGDAMIMAVRGSSLDNLTSAPIIHVNGEGKSITVLISDDGEQLMAVNHMMDCLQHAGLLMGEDRKAIEPKLLEIGGYWEEQSRQKVMGNVKHVR